MTDDRRDREIAKWMRAEAPPVAPDRLREAVRADVAQAAQEPAPPFPARRLRQAMLPAAAAVVILSVIVAGLLGAGHLPAVGGPAPTATAAPTATPVASATPEPSVAPTPVGVVAPPGRMTTTRFSPPVSFVAPAGWLVTDDAPNLLRLSPAGAGFIRQADGLVFFDGVNAYADPVAGSPDGSVTPVAGVGTGAEALATWLADRPQLVASRPRKVTVAGLPAWQVDFRLSAAAGTMCGQPCVNLLNSADGGRSYQVGYTGPAIVRALFVQLQPARTVLLTIEDNDGVGFERLAREAQPMLDTWSFPPP